MSAQGTAAIWLAELHGLPATRLAAFAARLSASEAARHGRFVRPLRQRQFLLGRMLLRQAVAALLDVPAATVSALERPGAAPRLLLADPARAVPFFSLSHSGAWVACAVSVDTPLGLDIEVLDPARDFLALAGQAFGPADGARLAGLPMHARMAEFYRLWSAMEARHKLGPCAAPSCVSLPHECLSIALCSAAPLAATPALSLAMPS